jgi:hypothetical protein
MAKALMEAKRFDEAFRNLYQGKGVVILLNLIGVLRIDETETGELKVLMSQCSMDLTPCPRDAR